MCEFLTPPFGPRHPPVSRITSFVLSWHGKPKRQANSVVFHPDMDGALLNHLPEVMITVKEGGGWVKLRNNLYQSRFGGGASIKINNSEEPKYGDMARCARWVERLAHERERVGGRDKRRWAVITEGRWRCASTVAWNCFKDRPEKESLEANASVTWPRISVRTTYPFNQ